MHELAVASAVGWVQLVSEKFPQYFACLPSCLPSCKLAPQSQHESAAPESGKDFQHSGSVTALAAAVDDRLRQVFTDGLPALPGAPRFRPVSFVDACQQRARFSVT